MEWEESNNIPNKLITNNESFKHKELHLLSPQYNQLAGRK